MHSQLLKVSLKFTYVLHTGLQDGTLVLSGFTVCAGVCVCVRERERVDMYMYMYAMYCVHFKLMYVSLGGSNIPNSFILSLMLNLLLLSTVKHMEENNSN